MAKLLKFVRYLLSMGIIIGILVVSLTLVFPNKYLQAVKQGGEWFLNNQDSQFIYYQYNPATKEYPAKHQELRELAALWSITELNKFLKDSDYQVLAQKGLKYFEPFFVYDQNNDFSYLNITPSQIKLGYNAFIILSLLNTDYPKEEFYLEKFANGLLFQQEDSGQFKTFFYQDQSGGEDYYPGEALLALMTLYEQGADQRYLNAVEKALPYYRNYWKENPNTAFVSWQSQAYFKFYQATKSELAKDFIFNMNDYLLEQHAPKDECKNFNFSQGIVNAVYIEGINKAYELAKQANNYKRANCYRQFIKEGVAYLLTLQFTPQNSFGITEFDPRAMGGFIGSPQDTLMQVDRNQHAVMALMGALELGIL